MLDKLSFPVSFTKKDLESLVRDLIAEHGWKEFELDSCMLLFKPYYFFSYDAYSEEKHGETGSLVVSDIQRGKMAMSALSGELEEELSSLAEKKPKSRKPLPKDADVEYPVLSEQEAKKLAPLKLAAMLRLPRNNVEISAFRQAFVPFWVASVSLGEEDSFDFSVNAVDGETYGELDIPLKPKTHWDLFGETVSELKEPSAWAGYTKSTASSIYHSTTIHRFGKLLLYNHLMQFVVIVLIIFLYLVVFVFR